MNKLKVKKESLLDLEIRIYNELCDLELSNTEGDYEIAKDVVTEIIDNDLVTPKQVRQIVNKWWNTMFS